MARLGDLLDFGQLFKAFTTINLPKSSTFLGKFCKGVKIFHFYSEIILFLDIWQFSSGHTAKEHLLLLPKSLALSKTLIVFPPNFWRENFFWSKLVFILLKESDLKNFVDTCCHADVRRPRVQKNYFEGDDNDSMDVNVTADVVVVRHYSFRRHCFSGERCF